MTTVPTLDELPDWPNPDSVDFDSKIGPFTLSLPTMVQQFNASIEAYNLTVQFPDGVVYQAQEGPGDRTSGRLMKVGAFGLGSVALPLGASDDLNDIDFTGFHYNTSAGNVTGNNYPEAVAGGLFSLNYGIGRGVQIYGAYTGAGLYWRADGAGWKPWQRIYTNESLVGSVSQSGGVPSGAAMYRGSNANGEYVRFADGTQICNFRLTSSAGGSVTWTFPAGFLSTDDLGVNLTPFVSGGLVYIPTISTMSPGNISFRLYDTAGANVSGNCSLTAIGRWY